MCRQCAKTARLCASKENKTGFTLYFYIGIGMSGAAVIFLLATLALMVRDCGRRSEMANLQYPNKLPNAQPYPR
jgi:hypothetical protein